MDFCVFFYWDLLLDRDLIHVAVAGSCDEVGSAGGRLEIVDETLVDLFVVFY